MNANWNNRLSVALIAAVVVAGLIAVARFSAKATTSTLANVLTKHKLE